MTSFHLNLLMILAFFLSVPFAKAQEEPLPVAPEAEATAEIAKESNKPLSLQERIAKKEPSVRPDQIPSLFFTSMEDSLIVSVRAGVIARPPTSTEIDQSLDDGAEEVIPRGPREIALGGIVYKSSKDWTIWLNGQKIDPKRLPPEILDIDVRKDHVRFQWYDAYTNQIFPVRLKPHERFNIDTRIFIPG